jgi:hypothetical protein
MDKASESSDPILTVMLHVTKKPVNYSRVLSVHLLVPLWNVKYVITSIWADVFVLRPLSSIKSIRWTRPRS